MTAASTHCLRCGAKVADGAAHHPGCGKAPATPEWIHAIRDYYGLGQRGGDDDRTRRLAREQAAESRRGRGSGPATAAAPPFRIKVERVAPCPGEFGPGGKFREHCHQLEEAAQ